jgi:hypothetical protein
MNHKSRITVFRHVHFPNSPALPQERQAWIIQSLQNEGSDQQAGELIEKCVEEGEYIRATESEGHELRGRHPSFSYRFDVEEAERGDESSDGADYR